MIENILDTLFNIFIYPIEYLMQNIVDIGFSLTNNYGYSIMLLSLLISLIMLPLSYLAEKLKNDNQKIIDKLQPEINALKRNYTKQKLHFYLQALYRTNAYHPINNIKASLGLLLQIPFFIAAFHFLGNYQEFNHISFGLIDDLSKPDGILFGINILPILMTIINLVSLYLYSQSMSKNDKYQLLGMSFIFLVLLYFENSALLLYWTLNNLFSLIKNWSEKNFNLNGFKNKVVVLLLFPFKYIKQNKTIKFIVNDIFTQASILLFGIIFIHVSIPMAASDTSMYSQEYWLIAIILIALFVISVSLSSLIYYFMPMKKKYIMKNLITFFTLILLFFAFIYPLELKQLTSLEVPNLVIFEDSIIKMYKLLIVLIFFVLFILYFKKVQKIILIILIFSNIILLSKSTILGLNPKTINMIKNTKNQVLSKKQAIEFYSFSKEANVIVILLDTFQGNLFYDILEKYPSMKNKLTGFVYYPYTLANGVNTWSGLGVILGGKKYEAQNMPDWHMEDSTKFHLTYHPKDDAFLDQMKMAEKYNYHYSIYKPFYASSCDIFDSYKYSICINQSYYEKGIPNEKETSSILTNPTYFNTVMTLIKTSIILGMPHSIKSRVKGILDKHHVDGVDYNNILQEYQQLKNMNDFANSDSNKKTFKFIHNNITHPIWSIDKNCKLTNKSIKGYDGLFQSGHCSFKKLITFFDTLKKINIYDKTKIIIVSEHGYPNIKTKKFNINNNMASALLLVKDFNSSFSFTISKQFLFLSDTYGIALSGVSNNKETLLDPIKNPIKNRSLLNIETGTLNYVIKKAFRVKENTLNKKWEEIYGKELMLLKNKNK